MNERIEADYKVRRITLIRVHILLFTLSSISVVLDISCLK